MALLDDEVLPEMDKTEIPIDSRSGSVYALTDGWSVPPTMFFSTVYAFSAELSGYQFLCVRMGFLSGAYVLGMQCMIQFSQDGSGIRHKCAGHFGGACAPFKGNRKESLGCVYAGFRMEF